MIFSSAILIFAILFFVLAWRRIDWAMYLTIFCLPAYGVRFQIFNLPLTLLEAMILILFFLWLARGGYKRIKLVIRENKSWFFLIGVFLIAATISIFAAPDLKAAAGIWKAYFLEPILFILVFLDTVKSDKDFRKVIYSLGAIALVISLFAIFQKLSGGMFVPENYWLLGEGHRVTSFYSYPNAIGLFVAPIVILMVGLLISDIQYPIAGSGSVKYWLWEIGYYLLIAGSGTAAIYFAKSDGAMVGLIAGIFFLVVFLIHRYLAKKFSGRKKTITLITYYLLLIVFFLIVILSAVKFLPASARDTLLLRDWSGQTRLTIWKESVEMLKNHWLFGAGLSGYQAAMAPYHQAKYLEIFMYPHNIFLNFWSETGIFGALIFFAIVLKFIIQGFKKKYYWAPILMASMVVILVHGLVDAPYFKNDLAILWWVVVGMMIKTKSFYDSRRNN